MGKRIIRTGKKLPNYLIGRDEFHLDACVNGPKGGAHGGGKRAERRRKRRQEKLGLWG